MPKVFHIHFDVIVSTNIFEDWVVWIKSFCLWDIQASNLTLVAKLIQGHKYICMFIYCIFACHLDSLHSIFPHLGYLITRLSWCLLLRTITVICNFDKHEEKEKESTSCGSWWPDVYGILRWSHGHSDSHVEKHSIMAGIISMSITSPLQSISDHSCNAVSFLRGKMVVTRSCQVGNSWKHCSPKTHKACHLKSDWFILFCRVQDRFFPNLQTRSNSSWSTPHPSQITESKNSF